MNVMLDTKKEKEKKNNKTKKFGKQSHHTISSMERKIFRSEPLINTLPPVAKRDENNSPPQCTTKKNE